MDFIDQRMPYKVRTVAVAGVKVFFKREEHQHPVHDTLNDLNTGFFPGPYLGAYVINDLDTEFLEFFGQAQVKARVINEDGEVGALFPGMFKGQVKDTFDAADVLDDLRETNDREFSDVCECVNAFLTAAFTGDACKYDVRAQGLDLVHQ
jgi:hypothetical protein